MLLTHSELGVGTVLARHELRGAVARCWLSAAPTRHKLSGALARFWLSVVPHHGGPLSPGARQAPGHKRR